MDSPRVVLLAGGVGGARMARGLAAALPPGALSVIVNVGDDERFYGLQVCPDLDTVLYTLAGRVCPDQGWGVAGDTTYALDTLRTLGAPVWMRLGDADFGLHIYRSWRLQQGARLTEVMQEAAQRMGVTAQLLPASDSPIPTEINTRDGWMAFQQWFVQRRAEPMVRGLRYRGASEARATSEAIAAIHGADLVVIAPSNPLLSILPMLALPDLRDALQTASAPRIAVSPLIGGKAVKGPLGRMLADLGIAAGNSGIARMYADVIDAFAIDEVDREDVPALDGQGLEVLCAATLIQQEGPARQLAERLISWAHDPAYAAAARRTRAVA